MKKIVKASGIAAAMLGMVVVAGCSRTVSPEVAALPDLTGVWENISGFRIDEFTGDATGYATELGEREFSPVDPPYMGEYARRWEQVKASFAQGEPVNDPTAGCLWPGVPRVIWNPYPKEILVTEGGERITFVNEYMSQVRRVFADGRGHPDPDELEPSYNGHSIGHWEGQTLVVDTVGLREDTMLQNTGMMHSDAMEVKERWRLVEPDLLEAEITMIDAKAFSGPYVTRRLYRRHRDWSIQDYVCEENNRERIVDGVTTHR